MNLNNIAMYDVNAIANEMIRLAENSDKCDLITNLKLQKLLYYQQGFHLAYFGTPLFEDDIEAWMYGPVVPSVYRKYNEFGRNGLFSDPEITLELSKEEHDLFMQVYNIYSEFSAIGLMNLTHSEDPWKNATPGKGHVITKESMRKFFKTRFEE